LAIALAKAKEISPARLAAFKILQQVEAGAFSSVLLAAEEPRLQLADRALCHELVLGVLRWQLLLDKIVEHFSERRIESLDRSVRIALRLGLYQLRYLTRIPPSAAVNESVSLVRAARLSSATAFVNALLRRAIREADYDPAADLSDPLERIAVQTSHPVWLIERWTAQFGIDEAATFAGANNMLPPTAFRVVKARAKEAVVLEKLRTAGAEVSMSPVVEGSWRVSGGTSLLRELSAVGQIYLQDEASQLVSHSLEVKRGDRVLDLCAAPGGKTTLMADQADEKATIVAADLSATRMETVIATTRLHGLRGITPVIIDAAEQLPFAAQSFDKVLIDAPCSGTGTLRRNPEIRWRLSAPDIATLAEQQKRILSRAVEVVKPGGRLVYSTCSVERDENEGVIEVLQSEARIRLLKTSRTWPHVQGSDGFFIAVFEAADLRKSAQIRG
jgi:16S rRNA (cytosine967-C5)-methyltransferase